MVAKLCSKKGPPEILLIHIEVQGQWTRRRVPARMYQYYSLLSSRYRLPIFPIAVYLRGGKEGLAVEEQRVQLYGREVLRFRYESVRLARLDVEEYREKGGPAGAALGALMDRTSSREPERLRASLLRRIAKSRIEEARQFLLVDLVETYFQLSAKQKVRYRRLVSRKEYRKVQDMELTWADEIRLEGVKEGLLRGKRETLKRLLASRFGPLSVRVEGRIDALASVEELDSCFDRGLTAGSLAELGLDG